MPNFPFFKPVTEQVGRDVVTEVNSTLNTTNGLNFTQHNQSNLIMSNYFKTILSLPIRTSCTKLLNE